MFGSEKYRHLLNGLRRVLYPQKPTTAPSIICENCHHQQSPRTNNDAVLASLMTLNAYLLAIFTDLEKQYWTIRSGGVNIVATLLVIGTILGFIGFGCWTVCLVLPYILGVWQLWWCFWGVVECIVVSFDEGEEYVHVQVEGGEAEEKIVDEKDEHSGEGKEHIE